MSNPEEPLRAMINFSDRDGGQMMRPVTDAKEVEVGNPAEVAFCHQTINFVSCSSADGQPFLVFPLPYFGRQIAAADRPSP